MRKLWKLIRIVVMYTIIKYGRRASTANAAERCDNGSQQRHTEQLVRVNVDMLILVILHLFICPLTAFPLERGIYEACLCGLNSCHSIAFRISMHNTQYQWR